jgi:hypothetical protein
MTNAWILHIKKFAKDTNSTYGCALSNPKCRETYKTKKDLEKPKPVTKKDLEKPKPVTKKDLEKPKPVTKKIKNVTPLTKIQGLTIAEKQRAKSLEESYYYNVGSRATVGKYKNPNYGVDNSLKNGKIASDEYFKLTGERLPTIAEVKKRAIFLMKQQKKIEDEYQRKKKLEPVKPYEPPLSGFRKKKIGVIL